MISAYYITNSTTLNNYLKSRHLSNAQIYKLVSQKAITSENKVLNLEDNVEKGDYIYINYSLIEQANVDYNLLYELPKSIDIIFEDSEIIAVDKKENMLTHSDGNTSNTIMDYLIKYLGSKGDDSYLRPLHRIDYKTKGVCLFAKNILAYSEISYQIENNLVLRKYEALVEGIVNLNNYKEELRLNIGRDRHNSKKSIILSQNSKFGKEAITIIRTLKVFNNSNKNNLDKTIIPKTLLEIEIKTGRTHQIRVTLAHIKHPIIGDELYGRYKLDDELMLISKEFCFVLDNKKINLKSKQSCI